jgi:multidrug efflux pump subunit AcrA (membrane-fusion protein)
MKAVNNLKIGLIASLFLVCGGTVDGAFAGFLGGKPSQPQKQEDSPAIPETPESQAAATRVDRSKTNLDQARKQLDAAKAVLKAADAEFRAARADQEALALRTQAQRLADSSGLTGVPMDRVQSLPPVPKGTNLGPTPADLKSPLPQTGEDRIDPATDNPVGQDMDANQSAPAPTSAPLRPSAQ